MLKQIYEIDTECYIKEILVAEFDEQGNPVTPLADNIVTVDPPQGLYRAKWTGMEWVEDMGKTEIDALNDKIVEPTIEERLQTAEDTILFLLTGGV